MHHCRVISLSEEFSDLGKGELCELTAEIHGDLPRMRQIFGSLGGFDVRYVDAEVSADGIFCLLYTSPSPRD